MSSATTHVPAPRSNTAAIVVSVVLGLVAACFLAVGGVLLVAEGEKDDRGYLSTSGHTVSANGYAIAADDLDVDLDGLDSIVSQDRYGKLRIEVSPKNGKPAFVGIARNSDVAAYLNDSYYSSVTDVSVSPFEPTYKAHLGSGRPAAPAAQSFWAQSAHGPGRQAITWDVKEGDWSIVVMNDDASRGVDSRVSAGVSVPFLSRLGFGALGIASVLLGIAGFITYRTRRVSP